MTARVIRIFLWAVCGATAGIGAPSEVVTVSSRSPLIEVALLVKAGSVDDPSGKEGLAYLTAKTLLDGGYGDPDDPVSKEQLALLVRPWGAGAQPRVRVEKEVTTFYATIPEDVVDRYLERILSPLLTKPLFREDEMERLRNETVQMISGALRYEDVESLGLHAIEHYVFEGTPYGHLAEGSVQGLQAITRHDLLSFYQGHYRPENLIIGLSKEDPGLRGKVERTLEGIGGQTRPPQNSRTLTGPSPVKGRHLLIVALPNLESTGIHAAFPLPLTRKDPDFWPLYVANVHFGTHRDSFSLLYQQIRQKRGYNYGDYSYIEHFAGRPFFLFPPFNTPRHHQYFSIWIRPVGHAYTHHLLKAVTYELERFIRSGMSAQEVEAAKNKAKVLYLNLAETVSRLLNARLDDAYYGMRSDGYLDKYLERLDSVTPEQVNQAIRKYLQVTDIKYLVVTDDEAAQGLAQAVGQDGPAAGKTLEEYRISAEEGPEGPVYRIPVPQLEILLEDAVWSAHPLKIPPQNIRLVPVKRLFETGAFLAEED